jgi:RhoGEF domain
LSDYSDGKLKQDRQDISSILRFLSHLRDQYDLDTFANRKPTRPHSWLLEKKEEVKYTYTPVIIKNSADSESRSRVLQEILDTERTYVSELQVVFDLYFRPIVKDRILTSIQSHHLFSNFAVILRLHKMYNQITSGTS